MLVIIQAQAQIKAESVFMHDDHELLQARPSDGALEAIAISGQESPDACVAGTAYLTADTPMVTCAHNDHARTD